MYQGQDCPAGLLLLQSPRFYWVIHPLDPFEPHFDQLEALAA
jgi:hypothetical protein